jgi:hypothetical protein
MKKISDQMADGAQPVCTRAAIRVCACLALMSRNCAGGAEPRVEHYMLLFLRFCSTGAALHGAGCCALRHALTRRVRACAAVPTVEYDYTV